MRYQINKRYSEHPRYTELMRLIEAGLIRGNIVDFDEVHFGYYFITENGDIYKKISPRSAYGRRGKNAVTHSVGGIAHIQFSYVTEVKECIPIKAKPKYTKSHLNFDFPYKTPFQYRKFCELLNGEYFAPRRREGIWKRIPKIWKNKRYCNAITKTNHGGDRFAWFTNDDQVKHLIEEENRMNPEDMLTEMGLADTNLDLNIQVKSQTPKRKTIATVPITCTAFRVDYTLEEGKEVCTCAMSLDIDGNSVHISEKEKVEIDVKGEKLIIVPIKLLPHSHGFLAQITGGSEDLVEVPIYLGNSLAVAVTKLVE